MRSTRKRKKLILRMALVQRFTEIRQTYSRASLHLKSSAAAYIVAALTISGSNVAVCLLRGFFFFLGLCSLLMTLVSQCEGRGSPDKLVIVFGTCM